MRTIKFRWWDKESKKMRSDYKISYSEGTYDYSVNAEFLNDEYIFMQFTGLKDKNGVEIYEGDIITFIEVDEDSCCGAEDVYTGVVKWIDEIAQWRFVYSNGQRTELHLIIQLPTIKVSEVIGNIYENKELLK